MSTIMQVSRYNCYESKKEDIMKKSKITKEIISSPIKVTRTLKKPVKTTFKGDSTSRRNPLEKRIQSRFTDFNLEAEAARMAYRIGISTESSELYRVQSESDLESDEDLEPIKAIREEREITNGGREEVIEKLKKSIKLDEKEGWEAFYN